MGESYAQLVVSLPWHKKVASIPEGDRLAAFGLYSAAVCFCQDNLTDGIIRRYEMVRVFPCADIIRVADILAEARLFDSDDDSYSVHDYLGFNKSRQEIEGFIENQRANGRAGGIASAKARAQAVGTPVAQAKSKPTAPALLCSAPIPERSTADLTEDDDAETLRFFERSLGRGLGAMEPVQLKQLIEVYGDPAVRRAILASCEKDRPVSYMTKILRTWENEPAPGAAPAEVIDLAEYGVPGE